MRIDRRQFVAFSSGLVGGAALAEALARHDDTVHPVRRFDVPLPIPPVLSPIRSEATADYYDITQREERLEILPGLHTTVWGYDGLFPGPTIKARQGRAAVVRHINQLATPTAVHLHGGVTPPESDGFPTDCIMPGQSRTYVYPNAQSAATLWYHDHAMDQTGRNIYMGLAGLYLVQDDEEQALGLPDGPHDVPLLIQDRLFAPDGSFRYRIRNHIAARGGTFLVNGAPWPRLDVAARKYRLRIVNGSNATPVRLALSSGQPMLQIATDSGLLPSAVPCGAIPVAMAERVEVIVDFSIYAPGTAVLLKNLDTMGPTGPIADEIMQFRVVRHDGDDRDVPHRLSEPRTLPAAEANRTRDFVFSLKPTLSGVLPSPSWRINGREFDPNQPIASPAYGDVEIWRFTNRKVLGTFGILHPIHVHLVSFLVLERNGGPPLPHETGWKDTVAVDKGEQVAVIARFDGNRGRYLLHCHNLEHEDHSMMARYDVI